MASDSLMSETQVRDLIRTEIGTGSIATLADAKDVSASYIQEVLAGTRSPGRKILDAFGLERHVLYRKKGARK